MRYLLILIGVFVSLTLGGLWLGGTSFFAHYAAFDFNAAIDYKLDPKGDADIVFYGDSTALYGIIPKEIERHTRLTTYNLALSASVVASTSNLTIERYLARHRPPKFIVLYMTPWSSGGFTKMKQQLPLYDATLVMLRYGSFGQVVRFLASHPASIIKTAAYNWGFILSAHLSDQTYSQALSDMTLNEGFVPLTSRDIPDGYEIRRNDEPVDRMFIEEFRRAYNRGGTRVVVYFPPMADSDPMRARYAGAYQTVSDNEFRTIPHRFIALDDRCIHLLSGAAKEESVRVGEFLRRVSDGLAEPSLGAAAETRH